MTEDNDSVDPEDIADEALAAEVASLQEDETVDFDSRQRQDEGWLKVYVECPDCKVPMARTTTESTTMDVPAFVEDASESVHTAVCPDCGEIVTRLHVQRVTADVNRIEEAFEALSELRDSIAEVLANVVGKS